MNWYTRLYLGAFKEFILSLDRTDALFVLILILCMGFGRSGETPSVYGSKSSLPSVAPGFPPPPYRAASFTTNSAQ